VYPGFTISIENYREIFFHHPVVRALFSLSIPIGTVVALARN